MFTLNVPTNKAELVMTGKKVINSNEVQTAIKVTSSWIEKQRTKLAEKVIELANKIDNRKE